MTDERMALLELIEKGPDAELVRDLLAYASERLMAAEVEQLTGAAAGARSPDRINHRNGYRERGWETRVGRIEPPLPKRRKGSSFPAFLVVRRRRLVPSPRPLTMRVRRRGQPAAGYLLSASDH